jgi:uncharacterized membrane protein YdbT with pleckstrin-like domain
MSEVLYDAHPSMIRSRPFTTLLALALIPLGIAIALMGGTLLPAAAPVAGVVGLAVAALAFLTLLVWYVRTKTDHLVINDDEIVWTHGLLNKGYTEINMASVRTTRVRQTLMQRIMNAGDVEIYTAGDNPELVVHGLPDPDAIRKLIRGQPAQAGHQGQPATGT